LNYDPAKPWAKIRFLDGKIACDIVIYVNDTRTIGNLEQECWDASHWVASVLNSLGLQEATRKRQGPSMEPGDWAGSIVHSSKGLVCVLLMQECWDKTKSMISWLKGLGMMVKIFPLSIRRVIKE